MSAALRVLSRRDMRALLGAVLFSLVAGCSSGPPKQLRTQAARDLSCSEDVLTTEAVEEGAQWVTGCGRRILYVRECDREGTCTYQPRDARKQAPKPASS